MVDPRRVLEVLQEARELVRDDWGCSNENVPLEESSGRHCASISIVECSGGNTHGPLSLAAHAALVHGATLDVGAGHPGIVDPVVATVWKFNDAQLARQPVVAAFDAAIARLEAELEPTPNADAALEVMAACERAGEVIARRIVAEHPAMDEKEIARVASAELFYAAQDTAKATSLGVVVER